MDLTSPSAFMRAATTQSRTSKDPSRATVNIKVGGSAKLVQDIGSKQSALMDAQSLLCVLDDDLRQLDMMAPFLGLGVSLSPTKQSTATSSRSSTVKGSAVRNGHDAGVTTIAISPPTRVVAAATAAAAERRRSSASNGTQSSVRTAPVPSDRKASSSSTVSRGSLSTFNGAGSLGVPPAYTSRRTSLGTSSVMLPPDYDDAVAEDGPQYPLGAFDPDATSFETTFNTSVRVHPKDAVSVMPRRTSIALDLLCPIAEELPIEQVAVAAAKFAYTHGRKVAQMEARNDLAHEWLVGSLAVAADERETRERLSALLVTIEEESSRYAIYAEYDKFVVFCMDNEPVWRRAARSLQLKKEERLNSTENTFARFAFIDNAVQQKNLNFQEYQDFMVSLKLVEHDELQAAMKKARDRRRERTVVNRSPATSGGPSPAARGLHSFEGKNQGQGHRSQRTGPAPSSGPAPPSGRPRHAYPTPPSGPQPNRPNPRRSPQESHKPSPNSQSNGGGASQASSAAHAHVRADRARSQKKPSPRPNAPLTAIESEPRLYLNRPLPPDQWMRVERVPNP